MTEPAHSEIAVAPLDAPPDTSALIDSLRSAGADRFNPLRWHYIEVLAERAAMHQGSAKRMLDTRLAQALAACKECFEQAHSEAKEAVAQSAQRYPHAADDLQRLLDGGDFKGLRRLTAKLKSNEQCSSLGKLVRQLEQHASGNAAAHVNEVEAGAGAPRAELKTIRNFRTTWAKLSVDKQVAQALAQAPKNAGPINSHMLVLRSLALMRDISPDYLNRFMSYADTLLCLDQGEKEKTEKPAKPKKRPVTRAAKK